MPLSLLSDLLTGFATANADELAEDPAPLATYVASTPFTALVPLGQLRQRAGVVPDFLTAEYETLHGGVGEGHEGYQRSYQALNTIMALRPLLARLGEQQLADMLGLFALGVSSLPSWWRTFESEIYGIVDRTMTTEPDEADLTNPAFLFLYPLALALQFRGDWNGLQRRFYAHLTRCLEDENLYNADFRRQLGEMRTFLVHDAAAPPASDTGSPLAVGFAPQGGTGAKFLSRLFTNIAKITGLSAYRRPETRGQGTFEAKPSALDPALLFGLHEQIIQHRCQDLTAAFLTLILQTAKPFDEVITWLLTYKMEFDAPFLNTLDTALHDDRRPFATTGGPELQAGWWQIGDVVRLVGSLAAEGASDNLIRDRILASSDALQYLRSTLMVGNEPASLEPLQLIYRLVTCADPHALEALILEQAQHFDDAFLAALHQEEAALGAMYRSGDAIGDHIVGDRARLQRLDTILAATISRSRTGALSIDRELLLQKCVIEALLHAGLGGWTLHRRAAVLCACLGDMTPALHTTLRQRLSDRSLQGAERDLLTTALDVCEQVLQRRSAGESEQELTDTMRASLALEETVDIFAGLGSADSLPALQHRWLVGVLRHAGEERIYTREVTTASRAQAGTLGRGVEPENVWEQFENAVYRAGALGDIPGLISFIIEHTDRPSTDLEEIYLRAYLWTTRAVLEAARGNDPAEAIGAALGHALQAGLHPLLTLFFPCWLVATLFARRYDFEPDAVLGTVGQFIPASSDRFALLVLRRLLPAFRPLRHLAAYRRDGARFWLDRIVTELAEVEAQSGGLMQGWSLSDWAAAHLIPW